MRAPELPVGADPGRDGAQWQEIQQGRPTGGGNRLWLRRQAGGAELLKLYGRRGSWIRERIKAWASPLVEARLGVAASERCALERRALDLWGRHGFAVPRRLELALPPGCDPRTALWMEWIEGDLLSQRLADPAVAADEKLGWVEALGREDGARHRAAIASGEHALVREHASVKHVFVAGDRLVHFDLETAFHPRLPIVDALAREISSTLRSLCRFAPEIFETLAEGFVAAHPEPDLLLRAARRGLYARGPVRALQRYSDRRRRAPGTAKHDMLRWLLKEVER